MQVGFVSSRTKSEGDWNGHALAEQIIKGVQADLKHAQVTATLPVEYLVPTLFHSFLSQVDDTLLCSHPYGSEGAIRKWLPLRVSLRPDPSLRYPKTLQAACTSPCSLVLPRFVG